MAVLTKTNRIDIRLSDEDKKLIEKDLNDETASYLRTELASKIDVRHTPKIRFIYDTSIEYGTNIEKKIQEIHEKENKKNTSL